MISVFDVKKLTGLLKDFYELTKIRIVVYDDRFQELCAYPEERAPICRLIRTNLQADEACMGCDRAACTAAARQTAPYVYTCHAGLTEAVSTVRVNSVIVGYLSFGQLFSFDTQEEGIRKIWSQVSRYGLQYAQVEAACRVCPLTTKEYVVSAAHILDAVASFLVLQRMAVQKQDGLEAQLDKYLSGHFTEEIQPQQLCQRFGIGKTKLYEIVRRSYGCGLADHIRHLRMERAQQLLLEQPELSVAEVATQCGYRDYNYFITVFSRIVGKPPRQFQREATERTEGV